MPISLSNKLLTARCLHYCGNDPNCSNAKIAASSDRYRLPTRLYICIGDSPPGEKKVGVNGELSIKCDLDIHQVGLLIVHWGEERVQGLCEVIISEDSPGWVFTSTGSTKKRVPVYPQTIEPLDESYRSEVPEVFDRYHSAQVLDPVIFQTEYVGPSSETAEPPEVFVTLLIENPSGVSRSRAITRLGQEEPLPTEFSHGLKLEIGVRGIGPL